MKVRTIAMFLYNNNIVSSNCLTVAVEPTNDFMSESLAYNREALSASVEASRIMVETIHENGATDNIITEAFADFKDRIMEIIRELKAKIIVLFRRWIDWITKKLGGVGRYRVETARALIADKDKRKALAGFTLELPEPTDFGFTYFNELDKPYFPSHVVLRTSEISKALYDGKKFDYDISKMRDAFQQETNSYLNGSKINELDIKSFENIVRLLDDPEKKLASYKTTVMKAIEAVERQAKSVGRQTQLALSQAACNAILALVTCLNEHLFTMASNFATYVGRIHKAIADFLPAAEEYLIRQDS